MSEQTQHICMKQLVAFWDVHAYHLSLHFGDNKHLGILQSDWLRAYPDVTNYIEIKFLNQFASSLDISKKAKNQSLLLFWRYC